MKDKLQFQIEKKRVFGEMKISGLFKKIIYFKIVSKNFVVGLNLIFFNKLFKTWQCKIAYNKGQTRIFFC